MSENPTQTLQCGLVMPISPIDGLSAEHWLEVKDIVTESIQSIEDYTFEVKLVSDSDDVGVIQKRIVQNLYSSDIVICDVSCKNANVMFELGMRLAFDKPTIIIKDDKTNYSFDTSPIEHIDYPRDLRFSKINEFKIKLSQKVLSTYKASKDPGHSTFLKSFGQFKVAEIDETSVPSDNKSLMKIMLDMQDELSLIHRNLNKNRPLKDKNNISASQIAYLAAKFKKENNIENIDDLLSSNLFIDYLSKRTNSYLAFNTKHDFEEFVKQTLAYA
ncbi:RNA helicase [Brevibacillus halotolerans]|uniref:RNA helicase n=1 Tax=Brevibacillus halotolerans TaxID=1507437 RepID=UPI0015EE94E2|nr:RNA helicase [Brevibacillus halotolerans]MBA4534403.1 RNA helicase [Brevibacillus halotolerans]